MISCCILLHLQYNAERERSEGVSALQAETLYYGDCLDWMSRWDDQCVDLIYLDPPFNSKTDYNVLYSSAGGADAQYRAFVDTWAWDDKAADRFADYENAPGRKAHDAIVGLRRVLGPSGMLAYLTYMAERLEQMQRLLKPTGSIYLHCDDTASHYLKVVMDVIFGPGNFRGEITWKRTSSHSNVSTNYGAVTDAILYYGGSGKPVWNQVYAPYSRDHVEAKFASRDPDGRRFTTSDLRNPGVRPNLQYSYKGYEPHPNGWAVSREKMEQYDQDGRLYFPKDRSGRIRLKRYLDEQPGHKIQNLWTDISPINSQAAERIGYPTQKPLALLERILKASSNEGDVVLDPFCGCGSTIEAASKLNRRWVGIDISSFAIDLIKHKRLKNPSVPTKGIPTDLASARKLAREQPFNFEAWAVMRLPGFAPNTKQVGDGGVDGRARLATAPDNFDSRLALAQVKGGKFSLSTLRDFIHVTRRDKAALGCYITLDPVSTPASKAEVADFGKISVAGYQYPRMRVWPIADYFDQRLPNMPIMNDPYSGKPMTQGLLF